MNYFSQQRIRKEAESEDLSLFLDAYEFFIGEEWEIVSESERPDFICKRDDGTCIGVELTKITRDPLSALWVHILNRQENMDPQLAIDLINSLAWRKELKRRQSDWQYPDSCLLVLQMQDIPLIEMLDFLQVENVPDTQATGFAEIWLADYSEVEAYGNVELFGLYPVDVWGYHQRPLQKPYG